MAKESKSKRKSAGRKAWRTRVKAAKAAGHKSVKVGKHRISIAAAIGGAKKAHAKPKKKHAKKRKAAAKPRFSGRHALSTVAPKRKRSKSRKGGKRRHASTRTKIVRSVRTQIVKVPGKTRRVMITAAEKRKGRRGHRRGHRRGYAMENPIQKPMEALSGGLWMLLGLGIMDGADRYVATHALTPSTTTQAAGQSVTYTDNGAQAAAGAAAGTTVDYSGMKNGAAVLAPMTMKRYVVGGALTLAPFVLAATVVKGPTAKHALHFLGYGMFARYAGKIIVDGFARLMTNTALGQQLYVNELAATAQAQAAAGQTVTVSLPNQTTTPAQISATTTTGGSSGLASPIACCGECAQGRPCAKKAQIVPTVAAPPPPEPVYVAPQPAPVHVAPAAPRALPATPPPASSSRPNWSEVFQSRTPAYQRH